jgi:putative nucleotidyltransferase with HDIG domain
VFASGRSIEEAVQTVSDRSGTWFDPEIARVVRSLKKDDSLWLRVRSKDAREYALQMEPGLAIPASPQRIDNICRAFAEVIDTKSPYTYNHSMGVAKAAVEIAEGLALSDHTVTLVRRAALLHDIGKLSVPNSILEKPGPLTDEEWKIMKMHPVYGRLILQTISGFEHLAFVASAHHERLDGSGYPDRLAADELPLTARIICVADTYQAITENRPYRAGLSSDVAFKIMQKHIPHALDAECLEVLRHGKELFQPLSAPLALVPKYQTAAQGA